MKKLRLAGAGLAVLASLTLMSACVQKPVTATPTESPKPALELLNDAVTKAKGQSFKYTLTYGELLAGDGARDATGANAERNVTIKNGAAGVLVTAKFLVVANTVYAKLDLGALGSLVPGLGGVGNNWMTVDANKLSKTGLSAAILPIGESLTLDSYIKGVTSAENVSATEIKGIIDLTKSAPIPLAASEVAKLGDKKDVPFTVTLDSEGRIGKIVLKMPAVGSYPAADQTTNFTDYGATLTIAAPPASQVVPAPETLYLILP